MKIIYLNEIDSTQKYLIDKLKTKELKAPIAVVADKQNLGIGSRGSDWIGVKGNLFLSFTLTLDDLPKLDIRERAQRKIDTILSEHQPQPLEIQQRTELANILDAAQSELGI